MVDKQKNAKSIKGLSSTNAKANVIEQTSILTRSAIALALCVVSLLLFRGPTSIVSTFIIPAVIVLFSSGRERSSFLYIATGLLIMTGLFFQTQIIFVLGYLLLSIALKRFLLDSEMKVRISPFGILKYLLSVILVLFVGIQLTQILFLIPLHDMMLRLSNHQPVRYFAILLLEGGVITVLNLLILKAFAARIRIKSTKRS